MLIVIPHATLLSPSGHRQRLDGLVRLLESEEISFLVPDSVPEKDLSTLPDVVVSFFREHRIFSLDVPFFTDFSLSFLRAIRQVVHTERIDLVVFSFPWGLSLFSSFEPTPSVYFSLGIEKEFATITLSHAGLNFFPLSKMFRVFIGWIEKAACKRSRAILCMSNRDADIYVREYGIEQAKIFALNQPVEINCSVRRKPSLRESFGLPKDRKIVVFHGSWNHLPNRIAIEGIRQRIAPVALRRKPEILFVVAGNDVPRFSVANLCSVGSVENLDELIACADVAIVPICEGSGVRMKIFDYFRLGIPVISTKKGIEGINVEAGKEAVVVQDTPEAVCEALVSLIDDENGLESLAGAATEYVKRHHDQGALRRTLLEKLRDVGVPAANC